MKGTYKIADRIIEIESIYPRVHEYCKDYVFSGTPEISVSISPSDIDYERERATDGLYPDDYLEELAVYRKIASAMVYYGTFLFHGSCVAVDGKGYLFAAPSGVGKSTHTKLWCDLFGSRAVMVNDDKPLICVNEKGVFVYGTPYNGKHRRGNNICVPLKAVCLLSRGEENKIAPVSVAAAYPYLLAQTYRPKDPNALAITMVLLDELTEKVKLYRLSCNMHLDAARISYEGMNEG